MYTFDQGEVIEAFLKSWGMILLSEIGDKTFFIAAIMAMKNSRRVVFAGALGALAAMTVLSAVMGWAAPSLISKKYTHYGAIVLFMYFGLRMLYDVAFGGESEGESELEEVERELGSKQAKASSKGGLNGDAGKKPGVLGRLKKLLPPIFLEAFVLTFLAEWGDRSQIATIGLAASTDVVGVTLGGILGHAICTGAAVIGGRQLSAHIDERMLSVLGGLLFIAFGMHAVWEGVPA
ncbi:hypothetical protein CVIRNUC_006589 [Coccomyxa viridis]|uniref:GDT1 family protein n=1 Tax=Coccomyxa viridis TaxID=1274662 RepID=A0AAV1IAS0_9CHLO|nr:hypothetical protein CVIRNUC_006589 [Coccomyxa viridis]